MRNLADVQITPTLADDGKVVSYDATLDKFILSVDAAGIGDTPNDGLRYVRKFGVWEEEKKNLSEMDDTNIIAPIDA